MDINVSHHLLLCATPSKASCCDFKTGLASWKRLKSLIKELGLEKHERPEGIVLRSKVDCLRICKRGPILLIWPDGIWYEKVTPKRIEIILEKHILEGNPQKDWIIKYTPQSNSKNNSRINF